MLHRFEPATAGSPISFQICELVAVNEDEHPYVWSAPLYTAISALKRIFVIHVPPCSTSVHIGKAQAHFDLFLHIASMAGMAQACPPHDGTGTYVCSVGRVPIERAMRKHTNIQHACDRFFLALEILAYLVHACSDVFVNRFCAYAMHGACVAAHSICLLYNNTSVCLIASSIHFMHAAFFV